MIFLLSSQMELLFALSLLKLVRMGYGEGEITAKTSFPMIFVLLTGKLYSSTVYLLR
jgi:hypothetical protein